MIECLLVGFRGGGGEEVFVRELARRPPEGVRYSLVMDHHESAPGAKARRLTEIAFNRLVHPFLWPLHGLRAYRVDERYDLVHVHNFPHRIDSQREVPVVMSLGGGSYYQYLRDYLGWPEARIEALYRRAGRVFRPLGIANEFVNWELVRGITVQSRFARGFLLRMGVAEDRIEIIPPGFPTPELREPRSHDGPFTFLFIGRDPKRKGADLIVQAIRELRGAGEDVRGIFVGDASFGELDGEAGLEGHEWVARDTLYEEIYPRADAFLLPARAEGLGLVAVEAMSFGLPVVVSRHGALPEIVEEGRTGLIVAPEDGQELREAMATLARDRDLAGKMGDAGRQRFEREYTLPRFHARLRSFYARALEG